MVLSVIFMLLITVSILIGAYEVAGFFLWFFWIALCCTLAPQKGRSGWGWGFLAMFFGPFALVLLLVAAPIQRQRYVRRFIRNRKEPTCSSQRTRRSY